MQLTQEEELDTKFFVAKHQNLSLIKFSDRLAKKMSTKAH